MIQMTHSDSANDRSGRSSLGLESGELAEKGPSAMVRAFERLVASQPGLCLGAALSVGILFGWWMKRR
jgi:hypothetical protein